MTSDQRPCAVVTGAAGGMGLAIARRLAEDGFRVLATDLDAARLEAATADIQGATSLAGDIADPAFRAALIDAADGLFAMINNAGIFSTGGIDDLTEDDFRRMYEINTVALFDLSRRAARQMAGGGRIVNIASRAWLGGPMIAHYAASKGAVVSLTRCMALELAERDILVNAVAPGVIDTPILAGWNEAERAKLASYQPLGRIGRPEDVANIVSMLASPGTDYITGQVIVIDGGRSVGGGNV